MLEFIKKNKKIILSSSIFTGINSINIYCGCGGSSVKDKKNNNTNNNNSNNNNINNNINNNTENPKEENPKEENPKEENPKEESPKQDENNDTHTDPLKSIKDDLKILLNQVIDNNNKLDEKDKFKINITPKFIDSKNNEKDLNVVKNDLNIYNNDIIQKINEINEENKKAKMLKLSDEDLSKIKDILKKYNITASDDDINKSYNLCYNKGLENCIHLNLKFKYRYWEYQEFFDGNLYFFYNFKNDLLINSEPSIYIIYSKELKEKYNCNCIDNHENITNSILRDNKESLIKCIYYIRKSDSNFIYNIGNDKSFYYFYNKEKNDYLDYGSLTLFSDICYCNVYNFYHKSGTSNFEEIKKDTATIDELLKNVKKGQQERKDNALSLVTTD